MSLAEVIADEYDSNIVNNNEDVANFYDLWDKITAGISLDDEVEYNNILTDMEYSYFTQGFIRGIAAAKGGLV